MILYHNERRRVYRPDEAPDSVKEKALARECEGIEPEFLSESVFGECGIPYDEKERGVTIETGRDAGPSWSIGSKGAGVGMLGKVEDVPKFLAYLETEGIIDRDQKRRLLYLERAGGISLRFLPRRGYGEGTVADSAFDPPEWPSAEISEALKILEGAWSDYVEALECRALKALEREYEFLTSWDTLAERLKDFGEGIDETGRTVPLSECEERPE